MNQLWQQFHSSPCLPSLPLPFFLHNVFLDQTIFVFVLVQPSQLDPHSNLGRTVGARNIQQVLVGLFGLSSCPTVSDWCLFASTLISFIQHSMQLIIFWCTSLGQYGQNGDSFVCVHLLSTNPASLYPFLSFQTFRKLTLLLDSFLNSSFSDISLVSARGDFEIFHFWFSSSTIKKTFLSKIVRTLLDSDCTICSQLSFWHFGRCRIKSNWFPLNFALILLCWSLTPFFC